MEDLNVLDSFSGFQRWIHAPNIKSFPISVFHSQIFHPGYFVAAGILSHVYMPLEKMALISEVT